MSSLQLGSIVQLCGLLSATHLNGQQGRCVAAAPDDDGRYAIQLLDPGQGPGVVVKAKAHNLTCIAAPPAAQPPAHSNDGVAVVVRPGLGRVLEARRAFAPGDTVILERPLLQFSSETDLVQRFLRMGPEDRAALLDMKHLTSPSDSTYPPFTTMATSWWRDAENIAAWLTQRGSPVSTKEAFQVLSVSNINCHSFNGQGDASEYLPTDPAPPKRSALFPLSSKAAHSCAPNCMNSSQVRPGHLVLHALTAIAPGNMITTSYIASSVVPTHERRDELMRTKDFFCQCPKCMGPDFASGLPCGQPGCAGVKLVTRTTFDGASTWQCRACLDTTAPDQRALDKALQRFRALEREYTTSLLPQHRGALESLLHQATACSCQTHWLPVLLLGELSKLAASEAAMLEQAHVRQLMRGMAPEGRRAAAAEWGFQVVKRLECIASMCTPSAGARPCSVQHPATPQAMSVLMWACLDLLKGGPGARAPAWAAAYVPLLEAQHGAGDADVRAVRELLQGGGRGKQQQKTRRK